MKRKVFSILFALVLACSLSLVTAVPAAAAPDTLNVIPFTLDTSTGTAVWSTSANYTGSWGVNIGTDTSGNVGRVIFDWNQNLSTITDMGYAYRMEAGHGGAGWDAAPYMVFELDTDADTSADTWVVHHMFTDAVDVNVWTDWELADDASIPAEYWVTGNETNHWHSAGATTAQYADWDAVVTAFGDDTVLKVKVAVGEWASSIETRYYVDDIQINGVTYYGKIQDAIDTASTGDTITVAAGTYTEDLLIPVGKDNLELVGATGTTIKGVVQSDDGLFPYADPNIDILSSGVKIHGFTIEGPDVVADKYASGMLIGASNVEIYDNAFKVTAGKATYTGPISQAIISYRKTSEGFEDIDLSGLNIHDNTFTHLATGAGAAGYEGIFINLDTGTGTATIADNEFTGNVMRAISAERSNMVISGNSIITDLAPYNASAGGYQGMYIGCYPVGEDPGPVQTNVSITGNTVNGTTTSDGFAQGIRVGHTTQLGLENITVLRNTVQDCAQGITVRADASGVTVNYNEITGNTVGVQNDDGGVELDAQYNWYGGVAGPQHSTNPYNTEAGVQSNDTVSNDVDYLPWMIHTDLASGWNIYSTPIAPDASSNTIAKALDLWTTDTGSFSVGWYFNGATQDWGQVTSTTSLEPMQAVYLKMTAAATIDVVLSGEYTSPPQVVMGAGWNLIGPAALETMQVDVALLSTLYGTGAPNLWGYSQVHSPALHQTLWTFQRGDTGTLPNLIPTEGYWVHMVNQGLLAGFTSTPITPLP